MKYIILSNIYCQEEARDDKEAGPHAQDEGRDPQDRGDQETGQFLCFGSGPF